MLTLAETLAFGAVYFCAGKLGLSMAFVNASASAVWPPTGLALAFLLWRGYRHWPGIFLGAFLVNVITQGSLPVTLGIACGNTLEALTGAWFVNQLANGLRAFETTRDAFRFILFAAMISTAVSALFGVTSLCLGGFARWSEYETIGLTWWLGDMVSDMIIAPLLMIWLTRARVVPRPGVLVEGLVLLVLTIIIGVTVFSGHSPLGRDHRPLEFLAVPPLVWAAFRFGPRGAISSAFVLSSLAVWGTLRGWGPFVTNDPNESLLLLQAFMGTASLTALVLALVVAERKRAEDALARQRTNLEKLIRQRTAKLRETLAELESFSYSITHDMRAPLRAMQNFAMLLEEDCSQSLAATGRDYCRRIRESAKRMDLLIQDALTYSRVVREEFPLQPVDLSKLLHGLVESYPNLQPPEVQIDLELEGVFVLGNQSALIQCFSNLLGNAVKFVALGIRPHVRVYAERKAGTIRVWLADNGIGIPPSARDKIFVMFQRVHSDQEYPGTGIGLAIVKKAVERMNGMVGVESEPGKGSRFWVELPTPI
jgi:signal transduction histidine kinase